MSSSDTAEKLLAEFCYSIDCASLERNEDGYASPRGTDGWSDLGEIYMRACVLLGRKPVWDDEHEPEPASWSPPAGWGEDDDSE